MYRSFRNPKQLICGLRRHRHLNYIESVEEKWMGNYICFCSESQHALQNPYLIITKVPCTLFACIFIVYKAKTCVWPACMFSLIDRAITAAAFYN